MYLACDTKIAGWVGVQTLPGTPTVFLSNKLYPVLRSGSYQETDLQKIKQANINKNRPQILSKYNIKFHNSSGIFKALAPYQCGPGSMPTVNVEVTRSDRWVFLTHSKTTEMPPLPVREISDKLL